MDVCWIDAWSEVLAGKWSGGLDSSHLELCERAHNLGLVLLIGERHGAFTGEMQLCRRENLNGCLWPVPIAFDWESTRAHLEALALEEEANPGAPRRAKTL